MTYTRFAVYYTAPPGPLADFGARWLGWDIAQGTAVDGGFDHVPDHQDRTRAPRKYGFHGTLKPPFRLADGTDAAQLAEAIAGLAARTAPAQAEGLALRRLGGFFALVPEGAQDQIARVAAACVTQLDHFRAPAGPDELARRRAAGLSAEQEANLMAWGYPYVLDAFRFHLTLTGRLPEEDRPRWQEILEDCLPPLPRPFGLEALTLVGERSDGAFETVARFDLTG